MNLQELKATGQIVLQHVRGSHMFGTNIEGSDVDRGGVFRVPNDAWLSLVHPPQEVGDEKSDEKYTELRKFLDLVQSANPTLLETLFVPRQFVERITDVGEELLKHRHMFVTKKCYWSYTSYAHAQVKRAKGQNKKVNFVDRYVNTKDMETLQELAAWGLVTKEFLEQKFCKNLVKYLERKFPFPNFDHQPEWADMRESVSGLDSLKAPKREDFCYFMDKHSVYAECPCRPKKLTFDIGSGYGVSSVEHTPGAYRLYTGDYMGVFVGGRVVCSSITKENERGDFMGLLYFNESEYEKAKNEYNSFWEWMANKNEQRWVSQENKEMDYDAKNMMHCARMMFEAEYIVDHGEPKVLWDGDKLKFLKDVRAGKLKYEQLLEMTETMFVTLKAKYERSSLPESVNGKKVIELYNHLVHM